jgi:hypothetical protein
MINQDSAATISTDQDDRRPSRLVSDPGGNRPTCYLAC